jgi:hypothetical protein
MRALRLEASKGQLVCVCVCVCARARACACACVRARACACLLACAFVHTPKRYTHARTHTYRKGTELVEDHSHSLTHMHTYSHVHAQIYILDTYDLYIQRYIPQGAELVEDDAQTPHVRLKAVWPALADLRRLWREGGWRERWVGGREGANKHLHLYFWMDR